MRGCSDTSYLGPQTHSCTHTHAYKNTHAHIHTRRHRDTRTDAHTHTHTHTHTPTEPTVAVSNRPLANSYTHIHKKTNEWKLLEA